MTPRLRVLLHGQPVGWLRRKDNGNMQFRYDADYVERRGPALGLAMPLSTDAYAHRTCLAVFGGVLPEQDVRRAVADLRGISPSNDYRLLEELGGDCAGAVQFVAEGQDLASSTQLRRLDESELDRILVELPRRPLALTPGDGARMSLAGAQGKLPVIIDADGFALPIDGGPPTSHILKPEPDRFPGLVDNEHFCMTLAHRVGLHVAAVERGRTSSGLEFLIVERYDRDHSSSPATRIHQEDVCQALARLPDEKYQTEGGPSAAETATLLRRSTAVPAIDIPRFWDALVFNVLIGNCDGHGKNLSLVYDQPRPSLAPLYDLVATAAYPDLSTRLAMSIDGATHLDAVEMRAWERCAVECGLGQRVAISRVRALAERVRDAATELRSEPVHDNAMAARISSGIEARAAALLA
jgi:serine/threonine-protein kinase HipA